MSHRYTCEQCRKRVTMDGPFSFGDGMCGTCWFIGTITRAEVTPLRRQLRKSIAEADDRGHAAKARILRRQLAGLKKRWLAMGGARGCKRPG